MKICRFNESRLGVVQNGSVYDVSAALELLPAPRWPHRPGDPLIAALPGLLEHIHVLLPHAPALPASSVDMMLPVTNPSKIIGAPVNYRSHIEESERDDGVGQWHQIKPISEWGLFLKAQTALSAPHEGIARRFPDQRTDHEVELSVIIGTGGSDIPVADALSHVAGYTVGLDITLRGPQFQSFRKSIDSYAMFGPYLVTADEIADPSCLAISLSVNGQQRQSSNTSYLILGVAELIAFASSFYTLCPGDIIMTGTPDGVGPINRGDRIRADIEHIGGFETVVSDA